MLEIIQKIIFEVTGKSEVTIDTDFVRDLELNSFDVMNIVCAFEDYFDTTIPTRDVWKLHQVRDVIEYARQRGIEESPEGGSPVLLVWAGAPCLPPVPDALCCPVCRGAAGGGRGALAGAGKRKRKAFFSAFTRNPLFRHPQRGLLAWRFFQRADRH